MGAVKHCDCSSFPAKKDSTISQVRNSQEHMLKTQWNLEDSLGKVGSNGKRRGGTSSVTLDKSLYLSEPHFPHLKDRNNIISIM